MLISKQGFGHYNAGINNQDFCFEENGFKILADGCSEGKFSEIGTRLFMQIFASLPDHAKLEKFEENVETTFQKILEFFSSIWTNPDQYQEAITNNLLFTIVACFELEDRFVVKMLGDGYIVTVNRHRNVSFLKYFFGKCPPYFAYHYCEHLQDERFKNYTFKTFEFLKTDFLKVGIATDGIEPIAKGLLKNSFDVFLQSEQDVVFSAEGIILANMNLFFDDVTILI